MRAKKSESQRMQNWIIAQSHTHTHIHTRPIPGRRTERIKKDLNIDFGIIVDGGFWHHTQAESEENPDILAWIFDVIRCRCQCLSIDSNLCVCVNWVVWVCVYGENWYVLTIYCRRYYHKSAFGTIYRDVYERIAKRFEYCCYCCCCHCLSAWWWWWCHKNRIRNVFIVGLRRRHHRNRYMLYCMVCTERIV